MLILPLINSIPPSSKPMKVKGTFYATDTEKNGFDIYHAWIGTPPSSSVSTSKSMMFQVGKEVELAFVNLLRATGQFKEQDEGQLHIGFEHEGVPVSGYIDAEMTDGTIVEVKSYYGPVQEREIKMGIPKTSYLKQLAIYMFALDRNFGSLIYINRGTGEITEFHLVRMGQYTFTYDNNKHIIDLKEVFDRWKLLYQNHILTSIEPKSDFIYKIPVETIDFSKLSTSLISEMRNGRKVYGDGWKVMYSDYVDLILKQEGTQRGYTSDELQYIINKTKGYSSKAKK